MTDAEFDALTARLRLRSTQTSVDDRSVCYYAADAITALRQERDNWCALAAASNEDFRLTAKGLDAARAEANALRENLIAAIQLLHEARSAGIDDAWIECDEGVAWCAAMDALIAALSREGK